MNINTFIIAAQEEGFIAEVNGNQVSLKNTLPGADILLKHDENNNITEFWVKLPINEEFEKEFDSLENTRKFIQDMQSS